MGLLTNSARGIWSLTDEGTTLVTDPAATDSQRRERVRELWQVLLVETRKTRKTRPPLDGSDPDTAERPQNHSTRGMTGRSCAVCGQIAFPRKQLVKSCTRRFCGTVPNVVYCHVCDCSGMSVPRVEPRPGDDVRQPGGLLGAAQRRDRHVIQVLETAEQVICGTEQSL